MSKKRVFRLILTTILIMVMTACSSLKPPTELAPDGELIQKAIALQLSQTEQRLSQQLKASHPILDISQITVKKIEPLFIANLATYHLQGNYKLKITLPRQQVTQQKNLFDIYLQRQAEGKTWRLIRRETSSSTQEAQWSSYLIK